MIKIITDTVEHELNEDELRLIKFAVSRLHPYAETCFRADELEQLNAAAEDLRTLFDIPKAYTK